MARRRRPLRPSASPLSPLKLAFQIVSLQLSYYVSAFTIILFTTLVAGQPFSLDLVFSWEALRGTDTVGWTLAVIWGFCGLVGVIFLLAIVQRSKLVLDFVLTLHGIHLLVTTLYTRSFPTNVLWWSLQLTNVALMAALGIWACQKRELAPISFGAGAKAAAAKVDGLVSAVLEGGVGGSKDVKGKGKEARRAADGQGSYEMVDMDANANGRI